MGANNRVPRYTLPTNVKLSPAQQQTLDRVAARSGSSVSRGSLVRLAIEKYMALIGEPILTHAEWLEKHPAIEK